MICTGAATVPWQYGDMQCVEIEMGQLDSYRLQVTSLCSNVSRPYAPTYHVPMILRTGRGEAVGGSGWGRRCNSEGWVWCYLLGMVLPVALTAGCFATGGTDGWVWCYQKEERQTTESPVTCLSATPICIPIL
eukprot:2375012-Rhodomonas_salina.1